MKKIISKLVITIIFLTFPFVVTATDSYDYYYSGGKKVFLKRNPDKICVLTQKTNLNLAEDSLIGTYDTFDYNIAEKNVLLNRSLDDNESLTLPCYISKSGKEIILTEYIDVKLKNSKDINLLRTIAKENNLRIVKQDEFMPLWWLLSITPQTKKTTIEIANELFESGFFVEVCPNFQENMLSRISWDKYINHQWGLHNSIYENADINISSAWNIATGKNIKIAIIDSGIDIHHQDLHSNISLTCNASLSSDSIIYPNTIYDEHGTHVAGIAAAIRNNGIYLSGVAPDAEIMSISVAFNTARTNDALNFGINWAWKNGADVINCSWGSEEELPKRKEVIDSALYRGRNGKGCVIISSSGNDYSNRVSYPGQNRDDVLSVGAITQNGTIADFSNYGEYLNVVAPGNEILSTLPNDQIDIMTGTSMAAPHVAGLAALILERNSDLTARQVCDIIEQNTTKIGDIPYTLVLGRPNGTWNEKYGYGLIDAYKALLATPRKEENY